MIAIYGENFLFIWTHSLRKENSSRASKRRRHFSTLALDSDFISHPLTVIQDADITEQQSSSAQDMCLYFETLNSKMLLMRALRGPVLWNPRILGFVECTSYILKVRLKPGA